MVEVAAEAEADAAWLGSEPLAKDKPKAKAKKNLLVRSFDKIQMKEVWWLWHGRFAIGKLSLIAGFPEKGKSQLLLSIAATITMGGEWPNAEGVARKGAALILSAEDTPEDVIKARFVAAGGDVQMLYHVSSMVREAGGQRVFNIHDDLDLLTQTIVEKRKQGVYVRLVCIDPLNAYFGGKAKGDSYKTSDMRAIMTPIADWADRMQVAVIGLTHFNKGGASNSTLLHRIVDSQAVTAAARAVYFCLADQSGRLLFLHGKNNLHSRMDGLVYKIVEASVPMDDKPGKSVQNLQG